jgi:hypothetical protein
MPTDPVGHSPLSVQLISPVSPGNPFVARMFSASWLRLMSRLRSLSSRAVRLMASMSSRAASFAGGSNGP